MSRKVYVKPPTPTRAMLISLIVVSALFLPLGIVIVSLAEGEARPFAAIFGLIWVVVCVALIVHAVKMLRLIKTGKIEVAEISDTAEEPESDIASRLRNLEALKNEGLISRDEYNSKRDEIMREKW